MIRFLGSWEPCTTLMYFNKHSSCIIRLLSARALLEYKLIFSLIYFFEIAFNSWNLLRTHLSLTQNIFRNTVIAAGVFRPNLKWELRLKLSKYIILFFISYMVDISLSYHVVDLSLISFCWHIFFISCGWQISCVCVSFYTDRIWCTWGSPGSLAVCKKGFCLAIC